MQPLPIYELASALIEAFQAERRLVIEAPTGSGKSTQVPQILLDRGGVPAGQIVVLQPRRLAARMLAARVARERGGPLGGEVGFQVRFADRTSARTRILYVTEGILLRRLLSDPELRSVHTLILDEFHERHIEADVALGCALRLQRTHRPDLRIVVMSATLDGASLETHLAPCARLTGQGRTYPVTVDYLPAPVDERRQAVWDLAAQAVDRAAVRQPHGDILVFMPGAYEIHRTVQAVRALPSAAGMEVLPLHGELAEADQDRAVSPSDRRKVVVATNVAETSLTIEGVRTVIDSGLARVARFDANRGINTLLTERITRDSADQRTGRAGRTAPGACLRLWTEAQHAQRPARREPEIRRLDLSETLLTLNAAGLVTPGEPGGDPLDGIRAFPWLDPPDNRSLTRAFDLLADLGALHRGSGAITAIGRRMASFPLHPRFSRMLLAAGEQGCLRSAALIAAMTQERAFLVRRPDDVARENRERRFDTDTDSEFFPMIQAWEYARARNYDAEACRRLGIHGLTARRVERILESVLRIAEDHGFPADGPEDPDQVRRCILLGFSDQLARRVGASTRYELVHRRRGSLAKESIVRKSDLLVAAAIREIEVRGHEVEVLLSLCTAVEPGWLEEFYPDDFTTQREATYDASAKRVVAREHRRFRDLTIETRTEKPEADEAAALLAGEVLSGRITLKRWDHAVEQWIARVNLLAMVCPQTGIGALDEEALRLLVRELCLNAFSAKELRDRPVLPVMRQWLSPPQQAELERLAPERLELSNGRRPKLVYGGEAPYIQARIQELYGITERLHIAGGRVPVVVHILAPNHRPVQITEDLGSFWQEAYPRVKKELQRRYPKHEWR